MQHQSLLAIFAHPDDESFGSGGTLAYYAAQGVHVTLICATRGEVGQIAEGTGATPETLAEVREAELRNAAHKLGVEDVLFLGYRDSGMMGTPENDAPLAFKNAPTYEVVAQLVGHIRRLKPQVVLTFDPEGGYGHPDHITIHDHTVTAFHAAADNKQFSAQGAPWQAERLFYTALPRSFFHEMGEQMKASGMDTSQFESFERRGWSDDQIQVVLDVSAQLPQKWAALNAHATQFGPDNPFRKMPEPIVQRMMGREHFALAWPVAEPGLRLQDLFQ